MVSCRLYLAALLLAIKFNEDQYYSNEYYSSVGGVTCSEINRLETEMLVLLNFDLIIVPAKFKKYSQALETYYQQLITPEKTFDLLTKEKSVNSEGSTASEGESD